MTAPIISIYELLSIYQNPDVRIFDVSHGAVSRQNYNMEHLEGASFIDLNFQLSNIQSNLARGGRHPLPTVEKFISVLNELGIRNDTHVIIYDDKFGANAAARFWWMMKAIGHEKVQVLNGGLKEALRKGFPMSAQIPNVPHESDYQATHWILPQVDLNEVKRATQDPHKVIIDVRENDRFKGTFEPIDLLAGHIPNAINMPYTENLNEDGLFNLPELIYMRYHELFEEYASDNIIVHCGSGVTACHTLLAMAYANYRIPNLYVGSWSEWSRNLFN
jgi:thiosulfate/3-mercaptopyruvate sulfurtransferase